MDDWALVDNHSSRHFFTIVALCHDLWLASERDATFNGIFVLKVPFIVIFWHSNLKKYYWTEFHTNTKELILFDTIKPSCWEVNLLLLMESNHAKYRLMRRLRSGCIMCSNTSLMYSLETSVLGADFVAMKQTIDAVSCIRCQLSIKGPLLWPIYIYGNNMFEFAASQFMSQCTRINVMSVATCSKKIGSK